MSAIPNCLTPDQPYVISDANLITLWMYLPMPRARRAFCQRVVSDCEPSRRLPIGMGAWRRPYYRQRLAQCQEILAILAAARGTLTPGRHERYTGAIHRYDGSQFRMTRQKTRSYQGPLK